MAAMTYRWQSGAENVAWIARDFGRCMAPGCPALVQRFIGRKIAGAMQAHLRRMGLQTTDGGDMPQAVRRWTENTILPSLDAALVDQPYLFGGTPSIADYALYGPLQAHLWRDPVSRPVIERHPHVLAWIKRLMSGGKPSGGWLANDHIPEALAPIFAAQGRDQCAALQAVIEQLARWRSEHADAEAPPSHVGPHRFSVDGVEGQRLGRVFPLYRLQRCAEAIAALDAAATERLGEAGINLSAIPVAAPPLASVGYQLVFQGSQQAGAQPTAG